MTTLFSHLEPANSVRMKLRPYQLEAVESAIESLESSQSTLIVLPTGCGKTIVFAAIIERYISRGRCLVLAHRAELIHQAVDKIHAVTGHRPEIEMAEYRADQFTKSPVIVSSIQTQLAGNNGGRMGRFTPDDFALVVIDEAHHAPAASYRKVIAHYKQNANIRILGVTATPDRADEEALGQIFDSVAYDYEITDAIKDGYLVPIQQNSMAVDGLDLSSIRTIAGDFNEGELARVMENEKTLYEIAYTTIDAVRDRKALVFAASVKHAEMLCDIFNGHHSGCARFVSGMTPKEDRRVIFSDYASGEFQYLVNCDVATEGFDEPGIQVVVVARPTKSRAKYSQIVGRGTRPLPGVVDGPDTAAGRIAAIAASAKPFVEVLDFEGNAGRHKLMTTADILGGNYSDEIVERAKKKARDYGNPVNMLELLEESEKEIHDEHERKKEEQRKKDEQWRKEIKANYTKIQIDPFDVLDIEPPRERGWDRSKKPSERMVEAIRKMTGGSVDGGSLSFTEAKTLIGKLIARREQGWCSFKQAKLLKQYGYEPKGIRFGEASDIISRIAANGWKHTQRQAESSDQHPEIESF